MHPGRLSAISHNWLELSLVVTFFVCKSVCLYSYACVYVWMSYCVAGWELGLFQAAGDSGGAQSVYRTIIIMSVPLCHHSTASLKIWTQVSGL